MRFVDDIVIRSDSKEQVAEKLERWRCARRRSVMKLSRSRTTWEKTVLVLCGLETAAPQTGNRKQS